LVCTGNLFVPRGQRPTKKVRQTQANPKQRVVLFSYELITKYQYFIMGACASKGAAVVVEKKDLPIDTTREVKEGNPNLPERVTGTADEDGAKEEADVNESMVSTSSF
jgi:hypothetical protein